jgi:hypothetical protein
VDDSLADCGAVWEIKVVWPSGAVLRKKASNHHEGRLKTRPVSPLIANIFLHYGFDAWMSREFPGVGFEPPFYPSAVIPIGKRVDRHLMRWARWKYKRLERGEERARAWLKGVRQRSPNLFAHWTLRYTT